MGENAPPKLASGNPCCQAWQGRYQDMKKKRDAFKEGVLILQSAMKADDAKKAILEKKLKEMDADRKTKEDNSAAKESLEKEITGLKSDIASLQQRLEQNLKEKSEEIKLLQDQASNGEKEINKLKDLIKKETLRADNAEEETEKVRTELNNSKALIVKNEEIKPPAPELRKELTMVKSLLASEKRKTESERKKADSEKKKADRYLSELEVLRATAQKTSSEVVTLNSNLETVKKQVEFEKQKTMKESKRADMESAKAREQMKLVEGLSKKLETVNARNEELKKKMELQSVSSKVKYDEDMVKMEEKIQLLEINKKTAMDWKFRADDLTQQLQEARIVTKALKKQVDELSLSQKSVKNHSISSHKVSDLERAEVRLLKKELKIERKCAKHSKKLAKLETFRREILNEELGRLKMDVVNIVNRMSLLDGYFSRDSEGTADLGKAKGHRKQQMLPSQKKRNSEKHSGTRCHVVASSGCQEQAHKFSAQLIPKSGRGVSESVSGTISQLESPIRGSRKLQSSGVNSSATTFSDGQLLASQGREQLSVTTSEEIAKDKPGILTKSSISPKITETRDNGNAHLVPEICLQSQKDSHEVVNKHCRKRKRMAKAVKSCKHLSSDDKEKRLRAGVKHGTLYSMLAASGDKPLEEKETAPDMQGGYSGNCNSISQKRRVSCEKKTIMQHSVESNRLDKTTELRDIMSVGNLAGAPQVSGENLCLSTVKGHDATKLFLNGVAVTDYMKLLELDNLEDESYYKMARESLLSPNIPHVDFLGGEIVSENKNPARVSVDLCDTINSSEVPSLNALNASVAVKMPSTSTALDGHIPKHFVVFSNIEDHHSIIRIFHAANNCNQRCPSLSRAQWAVPEILLSLKMEENLLAKERVCVFLSLLLHNFSVVSSTKIRNTPNADSFSYLHSFSEHIHVVMADIESGRLLSELSEELLNLLQDLLSEQRVLFSVKSSETSESDLGIPVTLNGENAVLFSRIALIDHLVAGSTIFAAISTAMDRVGFIFEASFELLHKHSHENFSVLLTILHVFAYIAGEKMMSSSEHDISITVLKSIVMFLENKHCDTMEAKAKLHPGKKCPFSDQSSSLEAVASNLVEILQAFVQYKNLTGSLGFNQEKTEFIPVCKDFQCVFNSKLDPSKNQSEILKSDPLCHLCDILSLVELVAGYMEWDWSSANIVAPLLKMLGTPLPMNLSVAIVSLLGQLGSIGVDAGGYEDKGLSNLRVKLSVFLQSETTHKAGFAVQLATVSSLLMLQPLDVQTAFQSKPTMLPVGSGSSVTASVNLVAKWFSLLSDEQQAFSFEFLQASPLVLIAT